MTNIEKVKRILDAGHWVKVNYGAGHIYTVISYYNDYFTYVDDKNKVRIEKLLFTTLYKIEVIQRIPTPYVAWDKVLVLSNPSLGIEGKEAMVWKVMEVNCFHDDYYRVWTDDKSDWFYFPSHCLSPVFEEDSLSGKEAKIVIDGKEYTCVIK